MEELADLTTYAARESFYPQREAVKLVEIYSWSLVVVGEAWIGDRG